MGLPEVVRAAARALEASLVLMDPSSAVLAVAARSSADERALMADVPGVSTHELRVGDEVVGRLRLRGRSGEPAGRAPAHRDDADRLGGRAHARARARDRRGAGGLRARDPRPGARRPGRDRGASRRDRAGPRGRRGRRGRARAPLRRHGGRLARPRPGRRGARGARPRRRARSRRSPITPADAGRPDRRDGARASTTSRRGASPTRSRASSRPRLHGFTFAVGHSRVATDPRDLYRAGNEALLAANVAEPAAGGEPRGGPAPVLAFEATGAYRLLLPAMSEDPGELQRFYAETVEPLVAYDDQYETDLVQTLETFLECDGNVANTRAAALHPPPHDPLPARAGARPVGPRRRLDGRPREARPGPQGDARAGDRRAARPGQGGRAPPGAACPGTRRTAAESSAPGRVRAAARTRGADAAAEAQRPRVAVAADELPAAFEQVGDEDLQRLARVGALHHGRARGARGTPASARRARPARRARRRSGARRPRRRRARPGTPPSPRWARRRDRAPAAARRGSRGTLGGACLRRGGPAADGVAPSHAGAAGSGSAACGSRRAIDSPAMVRPIPATPSTAATIHAVPLPPSPPSGVAATRRASSPAGVGRRRRGGVARLRRRRRVERELLPQVLLRRRRGDREKRPGEEEGDESDARPRRARPGPARPRAIGPDEDHVRATAISGSSPASPPA